MIRTDLRKKLSGFTLHDDEGVICILHHWKSGICKFRKPISLALLRTDCKRSAARTNRSGERGSPCLTPFLQWIVLPGTPLRRTLEVPEEKILLTQDIHKSPNPFALTCSILSKAFSKSSCAYHQIMQVS
jgi:hypothetical protein